MTESLSTLLSRVEAATGPDRELDALIYNALIEDGGRIAFRVTNWTEGRAPFLDRYHDGWLTGKSSSDIYANDLVRFTASLDAALALVEQRLPGQSWTILYRAMMDWRSHVEPNVSGRLPLTVMRALLIALQSNQPQGGEQQ